MEDLKAIIAQNITDLRKKNSITQIELASKLNYSDKAVSKWERGESVPDIVILKEIADLFGVTVDYLLTDDHSEFKKKNREYSKLQNMNHLIITLLSAVLLWFISTFLFVNFNLIPVALPNIWLIYLYSIPLTAVIALIFNSIWGKTRFNYLIITVLLWTTLASIYLTGLCFASNLWLIFIIGIPAQIIIILWSRLKFN